VLSHPILQQFASRHGSLQDLQIQQQPTTRLNMIMHSQSGILEDENREALPLSDLDP
jgi:hypothetical protein